MNLKVKQLVAGATITAVLGVTATGMAAGAASAAPAASALEAPTLPADAAGACTLDPCEARTNGMRPLGVAVFPDDHVADLDVASATWTNRSVLSLNTPVIVHPIPLPLILQICPSRSIRKRCPKSQPRQHLHNGGDGRRHQRGPVAEIPIIP